jgi:DNA topoisomerase-1
MAGIAVHNGPADDVDATNGINKRKSRSSISKVSYRDESDSDGEPLVGLALFAAIEPL